jgi:hypothetical protein
VLAAELSSGLLRLRLQGANAGAGLNRRLVLAGIAVSRLEPVQGTLEERFLEITPRLGVAA